MICLILVMNFFLWICSYLHSAYRVGKRIFRIQYALVFMLMNKLVPKIIFFGLRWGMRVMNNHVAPLAEVEAGAGKRERGAKTIASLLPFTPFTATTTNKKRPKPKQSANA